MCRAKIEAGQPKVDRRCDCDNSEARRLRRHTRDAIVRNAPLALKPSEPKFIPSAPPAAVTPLTKVREERFTTESVKEEIESISEGIEELRELGESADAIFAFVDRKLHVIGAGIDYLSENKYGSPTDAEFVEAYNSFGKTFLEGREVARNSGKTKAEWEAEVGEEVEAEFTERMTHLVEKRNTALRKSLADIGVEFADPETLKYTRNSDKEAVTALKKAISFYPQSWVDASNAMKVPLQVKTSMEGNRGGYNPDSSKFGRFSRRSTLTVRDMKGADFAGGISLGLHEFAHRVEHANPTVVELERAFLMRRSGHYSEAVNPVKPEELSVIHEEDFEQVEGKEEYGYKDNFPTHYMGKVYEGEAFEILSMGMESLFSGETGGLSGIMNHKADPDYKRFILGTLASTAIKNY